MAWRNRIATSAKPSIWIRTNGRFDRPTIISSLSAAVWLLLFSPAVGAENDLGKPAGAKSPAACSQVDYAEPASIAKREAAASTITEPPNPGGATTVGVGFFVNDIRGIDPVRDEFQFRGYVQILWCDPRLRFDPELEGQRERVFTGERAENQYKQMWFPSGYPVNKVGEITFSERVLVIHHDGTIESSINVSVPLATHFDLRRFPIDRQILELQVESYLWSRDHLQFIHDETISGFSDGIDIPEWNIEAVDGRVSEVAVMRSDIPFSRYTLEIEVARKPGFYIWKVFLPLIVIVAISWSIFWMTDERFSGRSRISATGVLTVVAYQFVFAENLPRVGYLTLLDQVMIGSFGLLAVTVLESLLVDRANRDDPAKALQIDRTCRWLFPTIYALMLAAIALFAG
ncbi:MAG: hypothetical protein JRF15_13030 [Deltaproteobacteria bacterium]|jgi:hypothetical protein|nr:hypothetical protein [Deltaproteobacteria bacterium]